MNISQNNTNAMKKLILALLLTAAMLPAMAQSHNCGNCPHHQQHQSRQQQCSGSKSCGGTCLPAEITHAFPTAKSVKQEAKWTAVYDAKKTLLGYAVYSLPASKGIKGYNGETPVMVALTPQERIASVTMLDNNETPSYLNKVIKSGLLKSWNDMKVRKAKRKKVDTVSGATYTSRSLIQTVQAAIKNL